MDTWWNFRGLNDPFSRLYYINGGLGFVTMTGRRYRLAASSLLAIPAHTTCDLYCPQSMDVSYIHCRALFEGGACFFKVLQPNLFLDVHEEQNVSALFERLCVRWADQTPSAVLESDGIVRQILSLFCERSDPEKLTLRLKAMDRFSPVVEYINAHLAKRMRTADLARLLSLHPTYFANIFSQHFGVGPRGYVLQHRIENAKHALRTSSDKLESIARSFGFTDGAHLSNEFKRLTGLSPRQYRRLPPMVV